MKKIDKMKKYYFFDPHPGGILGAIIPLPKVIKDAIDQIADKEWSLDQVLKRLGQIEGLKVSTSESSKEPCMLIGNIKNEGFTHSWRLLYFSPLLEK